MLRITKMAIVSHIINPFLLTFHSCYGWKWHFLAKKHLTKQKNINDSAKTYDILIKQFWKHYDLVLLLLKKKFFVLGMAHHGDSIIVEVGTFFRTTGFQSVINSN